MPFFVYVLLLLYMAIRVPFLLYIIIHAYVRVWYGMDEGTPKIYTYLELVLCDMYILPLYISRSTATDRGPQSPPR